MIAFIIFLASLSIRCLNAVIVDSYYMPSQPKQQVDTFALKDEYSNKNSHSTREKSNEIMYDNYVKPSYKYGYSVFDPQTLDVKSQWEHRDGDFVRGAYNVLEPDGSMRIVEYISDKDIGFRATVKKIPFFMDKIRRPDGEGGAKYSKSENRYQEPYRPVQNNQPLNNKFRSQTSSNHYSQNYVQKEKHQKNYYNRVETPVPVQVFQRLLPVPVSQTSIPYQYTQY